jgi:hypothetical protein
MTMQETSRATMLELLGRQRADYLKRGEVDAATRIDHRSRHRIVGRSSTTIEALADFGHRSRHQSLFTDIAASIGPLEAREEASRGMDEAGEAQGRFPDESARCESASNINRSVWSA